MNSNNTNKFKENNAELAKALVEYKKTIGELKTESSKYRCAYFDVYADNQLLKTQLNFAKKTVLDLFKSNTQNYTDVMRKLGIALTNNNNPSSKSTSSSARPNSGPIQCHSLDGVKKHVIQQIGPKKIASEVPAVQKDPIGSEQKPTTSTSNARLPSREPVCFNMFFSRFSLLKLSGLFKMDRSFTVTTSRKEVSMDIEQRGKDQLNESIEPVPKVIITSHSDGEHGGDGEELNISHTLSENSLKRSPVGRKMNYDQAVNTSLRALKEKKSSGKLSPVPDESNKKRILSPLTKSTVYNATKRSAQAHDLAQARLSNINKAKSPINNSKSPKNNIQDNAAASHSTTQSSNSLQQQILVEPTIKLTTASQQVVSGEGTSGTGSQPSGPGDSSNVCSNSTERSSSENKEELSKPLVLLKKLQRQTLASRTPKRYFTSPKENVAPSNTVPDNEIDKSPHRNSNPTGTPLHAKHEHGEKRKTMAIIEPSKKSNQSVQQRKSIVNNLLCVPSLKYINNNLEKAKENEDILTSKSFESTLQTSAQRSPLQTIQSPNISQVSNKSLERSSIIRNVSNGSKSPNGSVEKSPHSMERQSDDSHKRQVRRRTKSKENILIDDEQPMNGRASKSRGDERYRPNVTSMEMQSDDSNKRRARTRTKSKEKFSIDDEQPSCAERPRRLIATANYAEPKLNTKMRRNF